MALRFMDGFDHYVTADLTEKWSVKGTDIDTQSPGRFGGRCLHNYGGSSSFVRKTLDQQATWIVGCAVLVNQGGGVFPTVGVGEIRDGSWVQVEALIRADGTLAVFRGDSATLLGTSGSYAIPSGVWCYIETKFSIHNSAGAVEVRVNGDTKVSLTGINTRGGAGSAVDSGNIVGVGGYTGASFSIDDVYICDDQGADNADFLGDVRVYTLYPTADGASTQWTPSAGANHECVDDTAPNDDTDYVSSGTLNQIDTYVFDDLPSGVNNIKGVAVHLSARKDDAGSRSIAPVVRMGSTNYAGTNIALGDSYTYYSQMYDNRPSDAADWTASDVNSAEFGVKLTV